ncbi:somatostatin 1, tandem duplicate 1 [Sphaeramia orbicularis]|uniref:somatostatin 1, tandem duplicate 1 n=1 Tax=Sphaeramia orbicularis TaxID=375764 RepID=UPI0011804EC9|nr:somatostatin [Sphaeramia orbicularis]
MKTVRCLLLLLLLLSGSFSGSSAAQRDPKLRLLLHRTPLLGSKQETSDASLAQLLLSDLLQVENEAVEDGPSRSEPEPEDVHMDLERAAAAAAAGPLLSPRERKAGCKNFFWKTFTSC